MKVQFTDKLGTCGPSLLTLPYSSWYIHDDPSLMYMYSLPLVLHHHHYWVQQDKHVYTWRFSPTSVFSSSLQTVYDTLLVSISQSLFFCSISPAHFSILCTVYKLDQFVCQLQRLNVYNFSVKLATDSVMQSGGIPSCNKLVVSKSNRALQFSTSPPAPVSHSAPYRCTLPGCIPAV